MPEWDSEIELGEDLARALIAEQFSELDVTSLRRLGEGWDNTVWATSEEIAFRFPRRGIAIPGVEREMAILPELAAELPAPIPDAAYAGAASTGFPATVDRDGACDRPDGTGRDDYSRSPDSSRAGAGHFTVGRWRTGSSRIGRG